MSARPIPTTPEAIDAAWLSEALGARARRVELVGAHSGTTGRAQLQVDWEPGAKLPTRIFAKLPPTDATQRQMSAETDMGRHEARFYAHLAEQVPVRVPAPLWSGWGDDPLEYLMLLEDLAESGCRFPAGGEEDHLHYLRALMGEMAALHARYWGWPEPVAAAQPWVRRYGRSEWGRILVQSALDQFRDSQPPEFAAIAEIYLDRRDAFNEWLDEGPHTLVHGDSHLGNLFADGPRPGFLDWACVAHAPGMRDVAYHLCNSVPGELRRREERDLLERYRAGLEAAGVAQPPFEETWRDYRRMALTSWIAAVTTAAAGSRMQSIEVGQRAMRRSNEAVRELDSLGLLREALGA